MKFLKTYEVLLNKAETDLRGATLLYNSNDEFIDVEIVFFHLQQSIEKLIKALLVFKQKNYNKTHDLEELILLVNDEKIIEAEEINFLIELNQFAVRGRYDYISESFENVDEFFEVVKKIRNRIYEIIETNR